MNTFFKIAGMTLASMGSLLFNPLFWIVTGITAFVYNKSGKLEDTMLGYRIPLWEKVAYSMLAGLLGGLLGSSISVFLGITIEQYIPKTGAFSSGIFYIWVIALLLSLLNPRYLCFSYAGGIVALANLIIGYPNINAIGIMALVGILHLAESLLIWIDGHSNAVPAFFKLKDGEVVGGYIMNRIWPLPMLILFVAFSAGVAGDSVAMPEWWPIIKQKGIIAEADNLMYIMQPLPVILGYGDMAITKNPIKRCRDSAVRLAIYSIILIGLSAAASKINIFAYFAALFAPIGHELLILYNQKEEERGNPYFSYAEKGIKILYCKKDSPSSEMNIEPGDIIIGVNNISINSEAELKEALAEYPPYIWVDIIKADGSRKTLEYKNYEKGISNLGVLTVPEKPNLYFEINKGSSLFKRLKGLIKRQK